MKTINHQRRTTRPRPTKLPARASLRQFLRDATPIPGADALVLGGVVLGTVCAVTELVQRLTGWSL